MPSFSFNPSHAFSSWFPSTMLPPSSAAPMPFHYFDSSGNYSEELWKACAGPLVYVPQSGDRVWYFPQGHMEQVAASTQQQGSMSLQQLPNSGLVPQIPCRVVNRVLSAEKDTDEVYAQVSLLPESSDVTIKDLSFSDDTQPNAAPAAAPPWPRMFIKILTASDTSTHGGFSVLRKHAEECLPSLDMNQETPSQELTATDLHGQEWKFRHTYRGQPRRHLLTTGWSVFVSHKRLVAGDAVIFLRGANGELRVGIRRAKCQQSVQQAVMSSHSMHMGIVATASHALGTRTIFSVYYKPRASLSSFLVPVEKVAKSMSVSLSVGMRFKMRFEAEDASDRSYGGTIMAIEELDPKNWANSKWRSVRVKWDEMFIKDRQDRVSPWEIEAGAAAVSAASAAASRNKRFYHSSCEISGSTDHEASSAAGESLYSPKINPKVLQGQEILMSAPVNSVKKKSKGDVICINESRHGHQYHPAPNLQQDHAHIVMPAASMPLFEFDSKQQTSKSLQFCGGLLYCAQSDAPKQDQVSITMPTESGHGCKIFGVSLIDTPKECNKQGHAQISEPSYGHKQNLKDEDTQIIEPEIPDSDANADLNIVDSFNSTRSCTKVIKKGSIVGRGIDLTRFQNYPSLFHALDSMFHMNGKLTDPTSGWQVVYSDNDGDTMKVGDDPWQEFCSLVKKLYILSPEEVDASVTISP